MKRFRIILPALIAVQSCLSPVNQPEITEADLFQHLSYLASDSLKGRSPGSEEDLLAARYIAEAFREGGLTLLGDDGLQSYEVITALEKGEGNFLRINGQDFQDGFEPFPFTADDSVRASVAFCGYGLEIDEDELSWNDYAGMDVQGKWVMVLRGNPEIDSSRSVFHAYSDERDKAMLAMDRGAAGILFVSGPVFDPDDVLIDLEKRSGKIDIPAIQVSRNIADRMLSPAGKDIAELEKILMNTGRSHSFHVEIELTAGTEVNPTMTRTYNVIAYLKGRAPDLKDEYIVLGAHYDHLGMGGPGSSSRSQDTVGVHNGADDNASGVATLIEVGAALRGMQEGPSRSYLFIAFGAEEMGLLGSKHYVENPLLPLEDVKLMLNMDMVGRLRERQVQVGGAGTAVGLDSLLRGVLADDSLQFSYTPEGYGASDHSSFYAENIPVLFVTTGAHTDYHTPEDDVDRLNLPGMVEVGDYVRDLAMYFGSMDSVPRYREAGPKVQYSGRRNRRIALGIMPDFTDNDEEQGMRVDFVTPGKPAHGGGMLKGDIIMAIDGKPINGIYDYMYRLSKFHRGQIIVVTVARDEQTLELLVQL